MHPLRRRDLASDPLIQFQQWFSEVSQIPEQALPEAMCLSTIDKRGWPMARMVLLKGVENRGFVFYTNMRSPKADHLRDRPRAALAFYWVSLRRQVCVQGVATPVSDGMADDYFATRPRLSQLGAWASDQSEELASRDVMVQRFDEMERQYQDRDVPRPAHWAGFVVHPERVEFWQEQPHRCHDRFVYERSVDGLWQIKRLYP